MTEETPLKLGDILDIEKIAPLMEDLYKFADIRGAILDLNGKVLYETKGYDICLTFHRSHPETRKNCIESDLVFPQGIKMGEYKIYKCKNNLMNMATPIFVDNQHLGNLYMGQFIFDDEPVDYDFYRDQAEKYGFDAEEYIKALDKIPRWNREKILSAMSFYTKLTGIISSLSHGNLKLARTIKEKETLLKEFRHRVKNSFASITSLINLEKRRNTEEEVSLVLEDLVSRIKTISNLYDLLHERGLHTEIRLDHYLREICRSVSELYRNAGIEIESKNMQEITLETTKATAIGLILNELLTNIYKYAFPGGEKGKAQVELEQRGEKIWLTVSDTGSGFIRGTDPGNSSGFGFQLINMLAEGLNGAVYWSDDNLTRFMVEIPNNTKQPFL